MKANIRQQIIATILGGFIAASTGWFLDYHRDIRRMDYLAKIGVTAVRDDLQYSINQYNRIIDDYSKNNIIYYNTILSLKDSRQILYKIKEVLVLINNKDLREKISQYYSKSEMVLNSLQNLQKRKEDLGVMLVDQNEKLKSKRIHITNAEVIKELSTKFPKEVQEFNNISNLLIPGQISELKDLKIYAMNLLQDLQSY